MASHAPNTQYSQALFILEEENSRLTQKLKEISNLYDMMIHERNQEQNQS